MEYNEKEEEIRRKQKEKQEGLLGKGVDKGQSEKSGADRRKVAFCNNCHTTKQVLKREMQDQGRKVFKQIQDLGIFMEKRFEEKNEQEIRERKIKREIQKREEELQTLRDENKQKMDEMQYEIEAIK